MRFLDEEVLEVFVIHVDGATCESVSGFMCVGERGIETWEQWKS